MRGKRKPASFLREVGLGFLLSVLAAAVTTTALIFFPGGGVVRAVIAAVACAYLVVTLGRSGVATGRIVTMVIWITAVGAAWFAGLGIAAYLAVNIGLLWLVRALYLHSSLLEAALDLCLVVLAASFATWAAIRTDSVLLACWSFFVVQALHVGIPAVCAGLLRRAPAAGCDEHANRRFAEAGKAADEALRRIAALH